MTEKGIEIKKEKKRTEFDRTALTNSICENPILYPLAILKLMCIQVPSPLVKRIEI